LYGEDHQMYNLSLYLHTKYNIFIRELC
jgi:hypothetical protein